MNYNIATSNNFKIAIPDAQEYNFFIQNINLPSMTLPDVATPNFGHEVYFQGDMIQYEPLNFNFLVSEDFTNYIYIQKWLIDTRDNEYPQDFMKDITLHILNNNKLANILITFYHAFPTSLGELSLSSAISDTEPLTCSTVFRYQYFTIEHIGT